MVAVMDTVADTDMAADTDMVDTDMADMDTAADTDMEADTDTVTVDMVGMVDTVLPTSLRLLRTRPTMPEGPTMNVS
ncbi:hypothetical protein, partial [Salmonella sp. s57610]|uniref:hypothetical protein n=1 Tax=Salmonella sp. s57610 TaxID=3159697 RepID=UPI00397FD4F4